MVCPPELDPCQLEHAIKRLQNLSNRLKTSRKTSIHISPKGANYWQQEWLEASRQLLHRIQQLEENRVNRPSWKVVRCEEDE